MKTVSVIEFAKLAGISKQAVYQATQGKLKKYTTIVDGQKRIDTKALYEVYNKQGVEQETVNLVDEKTTQVNLVIEALTAQLKVKDEQIAELTKLLSQEQQIRMSQTLLPIPPGNASAGQIEPQNNISVKKRWWQK